MLWDKEISMEIKRYSEADEQKLFDLLREEGKDWECYSAEEAMGKYKRALANSITYVAYEGDVLCGYVRCRDDDGFGVYAYDLLVKRALRGRSIGRKLMKRVCMDYPEDTVYVMSGVDEYYEKLGYFREGSIYIVKMQEGS